MAVVMSMHWPEITVDHYQRALKGVRWEQEFPKGARFHVAWFAPDGFRAIDVWDSEARFQQFSEQRLMPVVATLGLTTQPTVVFGQVHRTFNPAVPLSKAAKAKPALRANPRKAGRKAGRKAKR